MLSLLSYKVIDAISSKVSISATIILSIAVLVSASNIYISSSISYYGSLLLLITLLTPLIGYITSFRSIVLPYISIL